MTLNGSLAGLVAITAGCDVVTPASAPRSSASAPASSVVFGIEFVDQKLKVDDPVGAVGVHCINGALGTILTGLFAYYNGTETQPLGLFYGGGFHFLGIQILGVVCSHCLGCDHHDHRIQHHQAHHRPSCFRG